MESKRRERVKTLGIVWFFAGYVFFAITTWTVFPPIWFVVLQATFLVIWFIVLWLLVRHLRARLS